MSRAYVVGKPIEHSLSPVLHNAGYAALGLEEWHYDRLEGDAETLPQLVAAAEADVRGFSVTMPGKFAALELADAATDRARLMGSANTLVRTDAGWLADNTDTEGVAGALEELLGTTPVRRALLIGAGGTARPALWALAQRGIVHVDLLNRSDRSAELAPLVQALGLELQAHDFGADLAALEALAAEADVIVSTVPSAALEGYTLALGHAPVLDVIYDRLPTPLMTACAANGHKVIGGHIMLAHQAYSQFAQFTGHPAPQAAMLAALQQALEARGH